MAVHHAVGISRQRNNGYRPSRVNIMAQGLFTPDPFLSPTHLSIRRGCATTTHYTHRQVSLMVLHNTTLVLSVGLCIGPACEARPHRWHAKGVCATPKQKERKKDLCSGVDIVWLTTTQTRVSDATAVTFSVKCFNALKFCPLSGNVSRKWFASYFLFIHKHLIIM